MRSRWVLTATAFLFLGVLAPVGAAAAEPAGPKAQPETSAAVVSAAGQVIDGRRGPAVVTTTAPRSTPRADARRQVVSSQPLTMGAYETWWASITCPAGMKVSGGGESNSSPGDVTLVDTMAIDGGNTWLVDARNNSGGTPTLKVHAVCWSDLDNYAIIDAKAEVFPGGSGYIQTGNCPSPAGVIGGGGWADTYFNTLVRMSSAAVLSWAFEIKNLDTVRHTVFAQAICGRHYGTTHPGEYGQWVTLAPGQYGSAFVACGGPAPVLYSGGGYTADATMTDLYPEGDGYRMYVRNPTAQSLNVYVFALCGR